MNRLNQYINEKLKISTNTKIRKYEYHPKDREELDEIILSIIGKYWDNNPNAKTGFIDLNMIDVSEIVSMSSLFDNYKKLNFDVSKWDVSKVKYMDNMFADCYEFNCDISDWNIDNVEFMNHMFLNCKNFNCNLSKWKIDGSKRITDMFSGCPIEKNPPEWYKKYNPF